MKIAIIYNKNEVLESDVINVFGMPTKETYNPDTIERTAKSLEKGGHQLKIIDGNMHIVNELEQFMPKVVKGERPGMVFNMAYGIQGHSRYTHIPSMLEMLGIPYVGSNPEGHAIALDKVMSKIVFGRYQLPTPAFWVFSSADEHSSDIEYPVIVKPKMEAVSFGLRVVDNETDLSEAVEFIIKEFNQPALVEKFIPGREFAVGLLGNGSNLETLPIVEIDLNNDPNAIQTVDDKKHTPKPKICPAPLDEATAEELRKLACKAFNALGLYDFARVDFRMDKNNEIYILEINSMASLGATGSYVHAAKVAGYDYTALINRMLDVAAVRYFGSSIKQEEIKNATAKAAPLHVRIRSYLRSNLPTFENTLKQLVSVNSYVHDIENVNTLGKMLSERFQNLGFHRQFFPQTEVGNILFYSNHMEEQNDILLLGHLDTHYDSQNYIPFYYEQGKIFGSGVAESKGGLTIILAALQALRFIRVLKKIHCAVLITTDDTLGGTFSNKYIKEIAQQSKYVVGTKFGNRNGGIVTACAGTRPYHVKITNIKNDDMQKAPNVTTNVCQKILEWQKLSCEEKGIEVLVDSLHVQIMPGRGSDYGTLNMNVQFKEKEQGDEIDRRIRKIAEKGTNSDLTVQVKRGIRRLPLIETAANLRFFETVKDLAEKLEIRLHPMYRKTSSDICHVPENIPVLDGLGPVGGNIRSANEYVLRDSLIDRSALLSLIIYHSSLASKD